LRGWAVIIDESSGVVVANGCIGRTLSKRNGGKSEAEGKKVETAY
jgi:hypothetical protein